MGVDLMGADLIGIDLVGGHHIDKFDCSYSEESNIKPRFLRIK